ncbi:hypothetical protein Aph01nite_36280 [Acrocarpospora phusangensis]|uniref:Uncharacterized protein n=1 Tax=Acrocarpospora phusangensis TaxID=1070424 RepID=A0A919QD91_9ACTN|nr:hypothetical protein [Acrocarpospora phusangensis]GIH25318.1 hypothetical protein Aph01nite_36280 [Acrocarpospora phusangensis]
MAEFGDADTISAAFVRDAPVRAAARLLLATGPLVGMVWGSALVSAEVWTWPVPTAVPVSVGAVLLMVVATLALARAVSHHYKVLRRAVVSGACGLVLVDLAVLTTARAMALPSVLIICALTVSLARIVLVTQMLIRIR